jgi:hypothetical protein
LGRQQNRIESTCHRTHRQTVATENRNSRRQEETALKKLLESEGIESNRHLIYGLIACLTIAVGIGVKPTLHQIKIWQYRLRTMDIDQLRNRYHMDYRLQEDLRGYLRENTSDDTAVVVSEPDRLRPCLEKHFLPFYMAPRPFYYHSDSLVDSLRKERRNFIVIGMVCEKKKPPIWTVVETAQNQCEMRTE